MRGLRLGERLVAAGRLSKEPLRRALELQQQLGGRLGTNLLEIGAIQEETLLNALGEQRSTRTTSGSELRTIAPDVLRLISSKVARRYRLVPYDRQGKTLFLASMDSGDALVEDEIRMLTGCMVRTTLALELRVQEALARYYQAPADVRVKSLVKRLAQGNRPGASSSSAPPRSSLDSTGTVPVPSPGLRDSGQVAPKPKPKPRPSALSTEPSRPTKASDLDPGPQFIELDAEDEALLRGDRPRPVEIPEMEKFEPPGEVEGGGAESLGEVSEDDFAIFGSPEVELEDRLHHAANLLQHAEIRDEIADVLLAFCEPYLERRLLLIQRQEKIVGWRGEGPGLLREAIRSLEIGSKEASVFLSVQQPSGFWLGPLPPLPPNQRLLSGLGGFSPKDCLVLPVVLRSKIVCYFYGDNGARGVGGVPVAELRRLMGKAGIAFEVYILKNKIRLL